MDLSVPTPHKRHYTKAPIIEAVIDIRVTFPPDSKDLNFDALADVLSVELPMRHMLEDIEMHVNVASANNQQVVHTQKEVGLRLSDKANSRILAIRRAGFSYSHLPPYTDWAQFISEFKKYWRLFVQYSKPEKVTRCAVRYINRIDIPNAPFELKDYLELYPNIPGAMPQTTVGGFHVQLQMPQEDLGAMALINEKGVPAAISNGASVMLDLDLFKFLTTTPESDEIWTTLEQLRVRKNDIFEAIITDETRRLIE